MSKALLLIEQLSGRLRPLAEKHDLRRRDVPPELALASGRFGSTPVEIETRVMGGDGFLSRLQIAVVRNAGDAMCALTAIAVPSPDLAAPIFGCDLVAFQGTFKLVALDLTGGELSDQDVATLTMARQRLLIDATRRPIPEFARGCLSELAAVVGEGETPLDVALPKAFDAYFHCFEHRLGRAPLRPWAIGQAEHDRYFATMRTNKRESKAMAKLFGSEWAERYFEQLFFASNIDESPEVAAAS